MATKTQTAAKGTKATKAAPKQATKAAPAKPAAKKATASVELAQPVHPIKVLDRKFQFGGEGTVRHNCWTLALKSKTVEEYRAQGGLQKYLPRWKKLGAIAY